MLISKRVSNLPALKLDSSITVELLFKKVRRLSRLNQGSNELRFECIYWNRRGGGLDLYFGQLRYIRSKHVSSQRKTFKFPFADVKNQLGSFKLFDVVRKSRRADGMILQQG